MSAYQPISVVIPSWNGKALLEKYLPSVAAAADAYPGLSEIAIIDNGSNDGTEEFIRARYPLIRLTTLEFNCGFSRASNIGISRAKYDIVLLLNNDMLMEKDFFMPLGKYFADDETFGVLASITRICNERYSEQEGIRFGLILKHGFLRCPVIQLKAHLNKFPYTFKLSGGAAVLDKRKFLEIGGFDELFSPFSWEDVDLSYRVWKRGWQILYEPKSLLHHQSHATINSDNFNPNYISTIAERNCYILIWKNITDKTLLFKHIIFIPLRFLIALYQGRLIISLKAIFGAIILVPLIIKKRKRQKKYYRLSDKELFKIFIPLEKASVNATV